MRAVVTPGRSDPRATIASESPRRIRSCAGVADNRLVQVPDLNLHFARVVGYRPQVSNMAIAANPDVRPMWNLLLFVLLKPLIELYCVAPNIGVCGGSHLQGAACVQPAGAGFTRSRQCFLRGHDNQG